jgi:hypothetical protein
VVGAPSFQNLALTGAAYVFEYVDGVWSKTAKLVAADAEPGDAAGISVALGKDRVLVGAHFDDDFTTSSGAAYLYVREAGGWTQVSKLTASDAASGDAFGNQYGIAVAISENFGLVGSWGHDASGNDSGAAYFYALDGTPNPSLAGSVATVDVSDGGQQELRINACSQWGGYTYIVVGSASGTSPGSTVSGVYMPLNYDIYYRDTLSKPNTAPLVTSLGTLDAAGKATATFTTEFGGAPGLVGLGQYGTTPGIVGLTLHHAYRVIDPNTLQVVFVSEPVPLQILP